MKTGYDVLLRPIITENSMDMAAEKKYAFKVAQTANKTEVRKAVEEIFGVDTSTSMSREPSQAAPPPPARLATAKSHEFKPQSDP